MKTGLFLPRELIYLYWKSILLTQNGWFAGSFPEAAANEEITNYPSTVDLINAIKYLDEQRRFRIGFLPLPKKPTLPLRIQKLMNTEKL
jgi:hypothetical protein